MPNNGQPNFDEEFDEAVAEWRDEHRLREDDAVMLLVELFRIHQRHWDEIRRRELPSFEQFRSDMRIEQEAVTRLREGAIYMRGVSDITSAALFEGILADEEHHIDYLETQLDLLDKLGEQLYLAQLIEQPSG